MEGSDKGILLALVILGGLFFPGLSQAEKIELLSPGKKVKVEIQVGPDIAYSVLFEDRVLLAPSPVSLVIQDGTRLGKNVRLNNLRRRSVRDKIYPEIKEKRRVIADNFEEVVLNLRGNYGLIFRAYDDGVAYRFFSGYRTKIVVNAEESLFCFPEDRQVWFPVVESFHSSYERPYQLLKLSSIGAKRMAFLPVLVDNPEGPKVIITEADLTDYPGMYLIGSEDGSPQLRATFPPYPLEEQQVRDRTLRVTKTAPYIAQTNGNREFPWRVLGIARQDGDLIASDLVYRLARPTQLKDTSWIKPGKVSWDWWNALNIFGVDFRSGVNTETYLYYLDFASKYGLDYVILDEGWSDPADLLKVNPALDMERILKTAREKRVGVILWCVWLTLDRQLKQALDLFARWGVSGIKVDFMDRDDQKMVNFYEKIAREAAARKLIVDFHGAYKPAGLRRTYPNVLTREGVMGLEYSKWTDSITPEHDLLIPFIRMYAGPMDYTPGAMLNADQKHFRPVMDLPMSQGTRCHQLAMYVVYESPLQMLCDSPSRYLREPEIMEFLSAVPTVWDETLVLEARVGDYVVIARQHGEDWYLAAMTDWEPRELEVELDFLGEGEYEALIYEDGVNADRYASDYQCRRRILTASETLKIKLAGGGGLAARLHRRS